MNLKSLALFALLAANCTLVLAQPYYVDANAGTPTNPGTHAEPFNSINLAVEKANALTGTGDIVIKIMPGLYSLEARVDINPVRILHDTSRYIIEAAILPDDPDWSPEKMPVIQSSLGNNSNTQFPHSTGLLVASERVTIRGIKFLGNPNPGVPYYYPISKENPDLRDLIISQCYFIGDKEAAKIQGAVWAHGPQNKISHCVFYGCRNAILLFNKVDGFAIEHNIIFGAYESAFWFGGDDPAFTFTNNVLANNARFLVGPKDFNYSSPFSRSVIANNEGFTAYWSTEGLIDLPQPNIQLDNVITTGKVELQKNNAVQLDTLHLHLTEDSAGAQLKAGIFKR